MFKGERLVINGHGDEKRVLPPRPDMVIPPEQVIDLGKKQIQISWRNNFDRIHETTEAWREIYPFQDEAHVNVSAFMEYPDKPFLLWFASDMHIGAVDTQHKLLQSHIELVENTPNTGLVTMGDDIDFGILPKMETRFMQAIFPYGEVFTARDLMEELSGRNPRGRQLVLAHLIGNHTHTMMETTGVLYESFYEKSNAPMFPSIGELFLTVGNQTYELALAHKYTGRSRLNVTLEGKRLMEFAYPNADLAAVGDFHKGAYEKFVKGGKERLIIRPGTYKKGSNLHERNKGWGEPDIGGYCVVFMPDRKEMLPFAKLEEGVAFLQGALGINEQI